MLVGVDVFIINSSFEKTMDINCSKMNVVRCVGNVEIQIEV